MQNKLIYQHFKGKFYEFIGEASDSETLQEMVVYRQLYPPFGMWVRPEKMFFERINRNGLSFLRFSRYNQKDVKIQLVDASLFGAALLFVLRFESDISLDALKMEAEQCKIFLILYGETIVGCIWQARKDLSIVHEYYIAECKKNDRKRLILMANGSK